MHMMRDLAQMFQYHTIELTLNKAFVLSKAEWDTIYIDRIKLACDPAQSADIAAVVMQQGNHSVLGISIGMA